MNGGNAATLALIAIVPLILLTLTSFVKLSVVLSLLRNAIGAPEAPSSLVVTGLSLILTVFVMSPVAIDMLHAAATPATGPANPGPPKATPTAPTQNAPTQPGAPAPRTPTAAGTSNAGTSNAGTPNAGTSNAGTPNAGTSNAGTSTAGTTNPGTTNAGTTNAGTTNAGTTNAGTTNAGTTNAGTTNAGTTNAGTTNAGTSNAGTPTAGTPTGATPTVGTPTAGTPTGGRSLEGAVREVVPPQYQADLDTAARAAVPLEAWLEKHAGERDRATFVDLAGKLGHQVQGHEVWVVAPAFVTTELRQAFAIAALIFLPFLVIDLVVGLALSALGLHSTQPQTVALPLKLLLFVAVDGWRLLIDALLRGYA